MPGRAAVEENVVIPQLVFWAEKGTFFLSSSSEVQPLLSPALQVLGMTENKIILTDESLKLSHSWEIGGIQCLCGDTSPCPCLVFAEQMQ